MASENSAQVEAAEAVFWVANMYSKVTGNYIDRTSNNVIPIECFYDSCQLVEAVGRSMLWMLWHVLMFTHLQKHLEV